MNSYISDELARLTQAGLARSMRLVESAQGPVVLMDGQEVQLLCSNDYLGLANHPAIKEAAIRAIEKWGFGAGASRLVSGTMPPHVALEERLAAFKQTAAALLFNSGYHANLGCITALCNRTTDVFSDRLNHASITDACVLSRARVRRYANRDVDGLERLLKKSTAKTKIIITDGVFSMDGTLAPLADIAGLLDRYNATLILDDAHATGCLGEHGRGTLERFNIKHPAIIQMGTLGKALGSFGAFIAGGKNLIDLLVSKSRPFIYTTALPPAVAATAIKALDIVEAEPERRARLHENAAFFRDGLNRAGFDTLGSETQIVPILTQDAARTMEFSKRLLKKGVFIQGIRPPTVSAGTSRLRASVSAAHTKAGLTSALNAIIETLNERD
ncbi:MAG: 8-amino-7-oxononanoate synthase [Deltaproteobacteria bacterium]|nr:8-amino-7-oxononanoate synthase [Deltaproteobacteria bacterium]